MEIVTYCPSRKIFDDLAEAVDAVSAMSGKHRLPKLAANLGIAGRDYDGELLIVGRAVNGSVDGRDFEANSVSGQAYSMQAEMDYCKSLKKGCQLAWVTEPPKPGEYNTNRSAFWRVSRQLLKAVEGGAFNKNRWSSRLAWTNLYKIAPYETGNPSDPLCEAQFNACVNILRSEIELLQPKRVLFMTGRYWLDWFEEPLDLEVSVRAGPYVEGVGDITTGAHSAPYVVAARPDNRKAGTSEASWVEAVSEAFAIA